jgi:hypothetical protein
MAYRPVKCRLGLDEIQITHTLKSLECFIITKFNLNEGVLKWEKLLV